MGRAHGFMHKRIGGIGEEHGFPHDTNWNSCSIHERSEEMREHDSAEPFTLSADSRWMLEVAGFVPQLEPTIEAVFALGNGYQGTRAALEEGSPASRPAAFIAG